ncbi:MAG: XrtN system VIT domain-containing protein, partial [Phycisphaerae bacterium]|nr:XrtN system VIT domain-containing protein [Saprospiraceae bacterium]
MTNAPSFSPELLDQSAQPGTHPERYNPLKDNVYIIGLALLALSIGAFSLSSSDGFRGNFFGSFMLHFVLVWAYTITLWFNQRLRWWAFGSQREEYPTTLLLLMLWLISCFALNREVEVFRPSADWLSWYLGISGAACVAYAWKDWMSPAARLVLWAVLSASLVLFVYYALALAPISLFGMIVVWFFGLPLHAWVPLVLCVYLFLILRNAALEERWGRMAVFTGIAIPATVVLVFSAAWYQVSNRMTINAGYKHNESTELPGWVTVSQKLEKNWLNGYLLKAVAEGNMPTQSGPFGGFLSPAFGGKENDPMMQIAAAVSPRPELDETECRKIYAAQYNARNVMEERLWSGDDLLTTNVKSTVMLDPGHRLSYTEKVLTVAQSNIGNSGRTSTQEALYTFFLPSGGAITSLSLWINGVEEPGILTTKSKAKEAYTTIVGRERRDPAVVFWQEGNQARVRVFPVTREMPRSFKIGVTAPLRLENQTLVYENVSFDGPSALLATERDSVYFALPAEASPPAEPSRLPRPGGQGRAGAKEGVVFADSPIFFKNKHEGGRTSLTFEGAYRHAWTVVCNAPPMARSVFSFDGKTYVAQSWGLQTESFNPSVIYLDLNGAWTESEFEQIRALAQGHLIKIPVNSGFQNVTAENATQLFRQVRDLRFTLFPYHKIAAPETALVITKSAAPTPLPSELAGSIFGDSLKEMNGTASLRVFHLSTEKEMSAYLRALRERRDVFCISGDLETLKKYLQSNTYAKNPEGPNRVALPEAGLLLTQKDTVLNGSAPDHLFRLFAYNTVLRELRGRASDEPGHLARLAEQANVVTPITSLVTLESKADYERFGIQKTEGLNTLGNA